METHGQKGFNGVAILSKRPIEVVRGLPGFESDPQARYIEAIVADDKGVVRVASIYLPNGNPPATEKYAYKLAFMDSLIAHARELLQLEEATVLAGDYNVIPAPNDVYDPNAWLGDALFLPKTRAKFQTLLNLGYLDALRASTGCIRPLYVLGLSGRRVAAKQRPSYRPSTSVAAGGGPVDSCRN